MLWNLGTAVNEAYFALFSMESVSQEWHLKILISTFQLIQPFGCIYSSLLSKASQCMHFLIHKMHIRLDFLDLWHPKHFEMAFSLKTGGICPRFLVSHCSNDISTCSLHFRSGTYWSYQWRTSGLDRFQHGVRVRGKPLPFRNTCVAQSLWDYYDVTSFSQFCIETDKGISLVISYIK